MKKLLTRKVKDIKLRKGMNLDDLSKEMKNSGGFTAKKLAIGIDILEKMIKDEECTVFLSFPAAIIATGTRGVILELIRRKLVDVIITTCGTLDHDLARSWAHYYHGEFEMDDVALHRRGINRLGNILIPNENYGILLEKKVQPILEELWKKERRNLSTKELSWEFGKRVRSEESLLHWCFKNQIPIYVQGIFDGAFGYQLWSFWQEHKDLNIEERRDESELSEIVFKAKRTGALMIGGGISKHHTMWWNQFRDGLDYALYVTTAVEYNGSLSGARVREGISWGKVREEAKFLTIDGDATVLLPLMVGALLDRL